MVRGPRRPNLCRNTLAAFKKMVKAHVQTETALKSETGADLLVYMTASVAVRQKFELRYSALSSLATLTHDSKRPTPVYEP